MTCQRPDCGHTIGLHEAPEDGMGGHEPCLAHGCDCPDYVPVSDAAFSYGDPSLDRPANADRKAAAEGKPSEPSVAEKFNRFKELREARKTESEDFPGPTPEAVQYEEFASAQGFAGWCDLPEICVNKRGHGIRHEKRPDCAPSREPYPGYNPIGELEADQPDANCPTCGSTAPERHPVVQFEGEVNICRDPWHSSTHAGREAMNKAIGHAYADQQKSAADEKKTVTKWADPAMFTAEPVAADEGPKVYLLWMTPDPLGAIAAASKMYKGEVVRDLAEVTDEERVEFFEQIQKTHLKAPFEFVQFHFMIEGVTRGFTHQMVRQRTATYCQESTRFAVKEDMPVGLPPSLASTTHEAAIEYNRSLLSNVEQMRGVWEDAKASIQEAYDVLIDKGMPAEDARGLLPTNVLTRLHYRTDLRALLEHGGNRLCTQAQFEWRLVFTRIVEAIRGKTILADNDSEFAYGVATPEMANGTSHVYMADKIADMFRPVCYLTGKCEFKASFDRACSIRERVDANESYRRPSSEWHEEKDLGFRNWDSHHPMTPWARKSDGHDIIPAIKPAEWLLNPGAAR